MAKTASHTIQVAVDQRLMCHGRGAASTMISISESTEGQTRAEMMESEMKK